MDIYGTNINRQIREFLSSAPRYKLVVLPSEYSQHLNGSIDIGKELSMAISKIDRSEDIRFQFAVLDAIDKIINKNICNDEAFGEYIILENPGILFEPALHIDVCDLLKRISKNILVIMLWPGVIRPDKLCFLSEASDLFISQTDINYAII